MKKITKSNSVKSCYLDTLAMLNRAVNHLQTNTLPLTDESDIKNFKQAQQQLLTTINDLNTQFNKIRNK